MSTKKYEINRKDILMSLSLRTGLAVVFFYAAISSLINSQNWTVFIPDNIEFILPKAIFLIIFSIYQFLLGILLLLNYKIFKTSILTSITLFMIILPNLLILDIIFRDIAILFMSITLNILTYKNKF